MQLTSDALVLTARGHGETASIVQLLTETSGRIVAYVHGGRSRRTKPLLVPGNLCHVQLEDRSGGDGRMPVARLELVASRAALSLEPLRGAMAEWLTICLAEALPEGERVDGLWERACAMFGLLDTEASAAQVGAALARFELALLETLGFQLDLAGCALTGETDNLAFVSPRTGRAATADAAELWRDRLLALPAFLIDSGAPAEATDIEAGLRLTRHFL
ncbi:MAG: DNA repair protein RecO, partial [Pacificimonas sp.]